MATIVEHKDGGRFVLLGFGYGMYKSARPGRVLGDLFPRTEDGADSLLAICDEDGKIGCLRPADCRIVEVDGKAPGELLS